MHSKTNQSGHSHSTHSHLHRPHEQVHTEHKHQEEHPNVFKLLLPEIQRAVTEEGYTVPTPIQARSIPHLLKGRDLMGCAQTGTGKTAAFVLPILQHLTEKKNHLVRCRPRALIVAPTRELSAQIGESIATYGKHLPLRHTVIFGGVSQYPQFTALQRGVEIVVATPGRLLDLLNQGRIFFTNVEIFVLDEADRMFDMGFIKDIRRIIADLPDQRQSLFFSATMAPDIISLANSLLVNPVHITIAPDKPTVEKIVQKVLFVDKEKKDALLVDRLKNPAVNRVIVFTQMKHMADKVTRKLYSAGITAIAIHGNKSQSARTDAMEGFKQGKIRVLVATDIAARGIDVDGITHIINYDLPQEAETYIHRIGRTARAGAEGDAISLCCAHDRDFLRAIEKLIHQSIPVDTNHPYHSNFAQHAKGDDARPPLRGRHSGGSRGGSSHSGHSSHPGHSSHGRQQHHRYRR